MLNIAVVGAGSIGSIHAANLAAHENLRFAAICDRSLRAARAISDAHDTRIATDIADLLGDEVDGIIIASSTRSHGEIAQACIAAGKPFLCEKPLAFDVETAHDVVHAATAAGLVAGTAFNRRFYPQYAEIRNAVRDGAIGTVEAVLVTSRTAVPPSVEFIKMSGGLFGEKGSHFYDLARWITGEHPVEVFAMGSAMINPAFAEIGEVDTAMITMRMPSGTLCQFDFSWRAAYGQDERLEVNGSKGMLQTMQQPVGPFRRFTTAGMSHDGSMPTWQARFADTYRTELDIFANAIRTGKQGRLPTLADGLAAQQIADAAHRSVREGKPVSIPPQA